MEPQRRACLDLFGAAALLGVGAGMGGFVTPAWLLAGLAFAHLWVRPRILLPLVLFAGSGWLLSSPAHGGDERPREEPTLVERHGQTTRGSRRSRNGGQVSLLRSAEQGIQEEVWLLEPAEAPPRFRGDSLRVRGWYDRPTAPHNPGQRARTRGMLQARVPGQVRRHDRSSPFWQTSPMRALERLSQHLDERLSSLMPEPARGLAAALVLGRAENLPAGWGESLRATGTVHFVAVSGLHVALLGGTLWKLLQKLRCGNATRATLCLAVVVLYAMLSGARPPVLRAALLFAAWLWQKLRSRPGQGGAPLAFSLLLIVALDPGSLASPGLQLSFAAVLGIAAAGVYRRAPSPRGTGTGIQPWRPFGRALRVALGATLATAPLGAYHFGMLAPWGPLASLLVAPLIVPLLLGPPVLLLGDALLGPLAVTPLVPCLQLCAFLLEVLITQLDHLPGTPWFVPRPPLTCVAALLFALIFLARRRPLGALACVVIGWLCLHGAASSRTPCQLVALDVGHGQAILWQDQAGTDLLDAGSLGARPVSAMRFVKSLRDLGVRRLRHVFVSHLDSDHAAFLGPVVAAHGCDALLLPDGCLPSGPASLPNDPSGVPLCEVLERAGIPLRFLTASDRVPPFRVLWPPAGRRFFARNEGALVLEAATSGARVLFPGDVEGPVLVELAQRCTDAVDLLVLPHHGNQDAAIEALVRAVRPRLALASRGSPLPPRTLQILERHGVPWISTFEGGALSLPLSAQGPEFARRQRGALDG